MYYNFKSSTELLTGAPWSNCELIKESKPINCGFKPSALEIFVSRVNEQNKDHKPYIASYFERLLYKADIKLSLCHFLYGKLRKGITGWNKRLHWKISLQKQPVTGGLTASDWAEKKAWMSVNTELINAHRVHALKNKKCYLSAQTAILSFECHECSPLKWAVEVPVPGPHSYTLITPFFVCSQQNSTPPPQARIMCLSHPLNSDVKVI